MSYLIDTNVLSEIRKGERCDPAVTRWADALEPEEWHTSVLVLGEIRRGVERIRRRDRSQARALESWLEQVRLAFAERILEIDQRIADEWGRLGAGDPLPMVDGLLAATAKVHGLTLVTRNLADVAQTGVSALDPFKPNS
ncbi:MAG: type II toxin-antitoxin system VapC family toxin [Rhodospirillales bacterium]|nr:type II toxin-antitoxin system VapC family toxin [Rhodospirillales bacterium]